jgi:hypothetical protein
MKEESPGSRLLLLLLVPRARGCGEDDDEMVEEVGTNELIEYGGGSAG